MANPSKAQSGSLRIIAGHWRGRKLHFPNRKGLRPTPDRVRETLFNWLQARLPGSRCLDLFAGSGALGFEAASRGAASVVMLEQDSVTLSALRQNAKLLEAERIELVANEALAYLRTAGKSLAVEAQSFNLVFIDPPYSQGLVPSCCALLESHHWLAEGAGIYIECDANDQLEGLPDNWQCLKSKKAGQVGYHLYIRTSNHGG